jgi:hypothetical protein
MRNPVVINRIKRRIVMKGNSRTDESRVPRPDWLLGANPDAEFGLLGGVQFRHHSGSYEQENNRNRFGDCAFAAGVG